MPALTGQPPRASAWGSRAAALAAGAAAISLAVLAARLGFFRIFSLWAAYDDEGYMMQSMRSYFDGHPLYDQVYTQYGPAYFLLQWLLHAVGQVPLTHTAVRLVTLAFWLATAAAAGEIVRRLTRMPVLALIAALHVFIHISPLINEPGHPQAFLGLIIALGCVVAAGQEGTLTWRRAACCGVLAGMAALTKINVGAFLFLGAAVPLACATPLTRRAGPLLPLLAAAVPLIIFKHHLAGRSAEYAAVGALAAAAVTWVCYRVYAPVPQKPALLGALAAACAATMTTIVAAMMAQGTTVYALVDSLLVAPTRLAALYYVPVEVPRPAVVAAAASLAAAVVFGRSGAPASRAWLMAVLAAKAAFGAGALYASRLGYLELVAYVTPFIWIVVLPTGSESARMLLARGVLAATAAFEVLQAYPVGGTQVAFATMLTIPCALVALGDAFAIVTRHVVVSRVAPLALTAATIAWAAFFYRPVFGSEVRQHYDAAYHARHALQLPGTTYVRLLPHEVKLLHWLTGTLKANCDSFVSVPGFNSLYFWSGIAPLTTQNAGTWMSLLSSGEQARIWNRVDASAAPCGILNVFIANNWLGDPVDSFQAYRELAARFTAVAEVSAFQFMMPASRRSEWSGRMGLASGTVTFDQGRDHLPIEPAFIVDRPELTLRFRVRSERTGVVLGCQSSVPNAERPARLGPLAYLGSDGVLYAQHPVSGAQPPLASMAPINDGNWHHVALTRSGAAQTLFVDGVRQSTADAPIAAAGEMHCQLGTGYTSSLPRARLGWMSFRGEVADVETIPKAWTEEQVRADLDVRR